MFYAYYVRKIAFSFIYSYINILKLFLWTGKLYKFKAFGPISVFIHPSAKLTIGRNCRINSGFLFNPYRNYNKFSIVLHKNSILEIGNDVGFSNCTIIVKKRVTIGDNVLIGGGTLICDSDLHSLDSEQRANKKEDVLTKEIIIGNSSFIGGGVTILKGVVIGENSIIGACSVVSKDVSNNSIFAGNPSKLIKRLS